MTHATTNLGGTASNVVIGKVAHGLMSMTWVLWKPNPVPDEQCFEAIKTGINALPLPPGTKMFLNGGKRVLRPQFIRNYSEKYPEFVDRTFLSIKGWLKAGGFPEPDGLPENLLRSVNTINEKLRGTKRLDLFHCTRVDPNIPVEESIAALAKLKGQGKLGHIEMSECSAETLHRGTQGWYMAYIIHPISVVEIEISIFSYEPPAREVIVTAKELGIAVAAYSPLGKGFLTGKLKKLEDLSADDIRRHFPRFQQDVGFNFACGIVRPRLPTFVGAESDNA